jgi:hypothetical protein
MSLSIKLLVPLALGVLLSDCGTEPDALLRCSPLLAITVTGSPLTFAWEPSDCAVYSIAVEQGNPGNVSRTAWYLASEQNDLHGPIRYGVDPRTGTTAAGAEDLVVGPYTVEIARLNAQGSALELSRAGFSFTGE